MLFCLLLSHIALGLSDISDADSQLKSLTLADCTKEKIAALIKRNSPLLALIPKKIGEKETEHMYSVIAKSGDKTQKDIATKFLYCKKCNLLMLKDGGHVSRHAKSCFNFGFKRQGEEVETAVVAKKPILDIGGFTTVPLNDAERKKVTSMIANFAMDSATSFRLCESLPFQHMVTRLIAFG